MGDLWVTIPTAGRDTLEAAIDSTGVDRSRVVVVTTAPNVLPPVGCLTAPDLGPINIHRWWNRGINLAESHGARYVAVLNDDVLLDPDSLPALVDAMDGATLASPGDECRSTDPSKDRPRTITGSCWILDVRHGLRPDEGYRWWYGDDDLDWRARRDHHGVVRAPVPFTHLAPNQLTASNPDLQRLTQADAVRWSAA